MTLKIMCNSYLCEVARMTFTTKGQSKTTSLLVLSLTKVRLHTNDPRKAHPRWELLNDIEMMECCCC